MNDLTFDLTDVMPTSIDELISNLAVNISDELSDLDTANDDYTDEYKQQLFEAMTKLYALVETKFVMG